MYVTAVLTYNRNGFYSTNYVTWIYLIIFAFALPGELENHSNLPMSCLISFRLLAHASSSAYYELELGSFPDSDMKSALENLELRRPVSGEDGDRKKGRSCSHSRKIFVKCRSRMEFFLFSKTS